jgi:predicted O-methyltransferase YrrM
MQPEVNSYRWQGGSKIESNNEECYKKYNKYNELIANVTVNEKIEEGSLLDQIKFFIDYLVSNPEIRLVLEIGFNTGASAAAFLASRDDILVMSVDIGHHKYIIPYKKILDSQFPNRHTLIIGDSKDIIPRLGALKPDLIFIDGDHIEPTPLIDARNCLALAHKNTVLIMDDTNLLNGWAGVLQGMCELIKKGEIDRTRIMTAGSSDNTWTLFWKPTTL